MRRRTLLAGCATLAVAGTAGVLLIDDPLQRFMDRSVSLTGISDLDPELGAEVLAAFDAREPPDPDDADLLTAWYTGAIESDGTWQLVTYRDALIWQVLTFAHPLGLCGGAFGSWGHPPEV
ncbi:MAG: hypothetical protein Kilf2KO_44960 [Rhodospirillales bacterium]